MGRLGRLRMSRRRRAAIGLTVGVLLIAFGVFLVFGVGWAAIALGVAVTAIFLAVYDVDEPEQAALESTLPRLAPRSEDVWP